MATLSVNIPEPMKDFVNRQVGSGLFKDESAYVQFLIAEAMESRQVDFSAEEKARVDQLLLESLDSFERGESAPVRPGEFADLARRMVEQHQGRQAS